MPINRRDFLGSFGAASIAAAVPSAARASSAPPNEAWDTSWVERVKGKYRAVFDSPGFSEGAGLFRAVVWTRHYREVYGTSPADMSAVLVVRHVGIWLAMNDEFWQKYGVGKRQKFRNSDKKQWFERNPIASSAPGTPPEFDINIPKFVKEGNIVLACHLAFGGVVDLVSKEGKLQGSDAEKAAREYLLPGVIMQPSGIFAVLRAQEAGCHYILAS